VVVEEPEEPVDPDVNRRWLNHGGVERLQNDPLGVNFGTNVAVGDQHSLKITVLAGERSARDECYSPVCSSRTDLSCSNWQTSAFIRRRKGDFSRARRPRGSRSTAKRTRVLPPSVLR